MKIFTLTLGFTLCSLLTIGQQLKPNLLSAAHEHKKWAPVISAGDILKDFRAYTSCFDGPDDDDGDGVNDTLRVPHWVAYQINKTEEECISTFDRPNPWITDDELFRKGIMCSDVSYKYPEAVRERKKDWFERGHLCMKMHAERLGADAGWNSHIFYNSVPQRGDFNKGIWLDMEYLTDQWAQRFDKVWIMAGPVFADGSPLAYIGEPGELRVAIPDALFKIVVKENGTDLPDVLAFIYPQFGAGYATRLSSGYEHVAYLTTVDEIEKVTGLKFFANQSESVRKKLIKLKADSLWMVERADLIPPCRSNQ